MQLVCFIVLFIFRWHFLQNRETHQFNGTSFLLLHRIEDKFCWATTMIPWKMAILLFVLSWTFFLFYNEIEHGIVIFTTPMNSMHSITEFLSLQKQTKKRNALLESFGFWTELVCWCMQKKKKRKKNTNKTKSWMNREKNHKDITQPHDILTTTMNCWTKYGMPKCMCCIRRMVDSKRMHSTRLW